MNQSQKNVAQVLYSVTGDGALALDNEDDCRSLCQDFARALNLTHSEDFAKACGYTSAADMNQARDCEGAECGNCRGCNEEPDMHVFEYARETSIKNDPDTIANSTVSDGVGALCGKCGESQSAHN